MICSETSIGQKTFHDIIYEDLNMKDMCVYIGSQPNAVTQTEWTFFVKCRPYIIKDTEDFFARLVRDSKSWLHFHTPDNKRLSVQWKHPGSSHSKIILKWSFCGKTSGHNFLGLTGNITNELALYWCNNQQCRLVSKKSKLKLYWSIRRQIERYGRETWGLKGTIKKTS
jgi:hypothetical protein